MIPQCSVFLSTYPIRAATLELAEERLGFLLAVLKPDVILVFSVLDGTRVGSRQLPIG